MREIVDEILAAEKEAEGLVRDARSQADEIRGRADAEVAERVKRAHQQAQELIHRRVDESRRRVDKEHRSEMDETRRKSESSFTENADRFDRVVQALTELIIEPAHRRE